MEGSSTSDGFVIPASAHYQDDFPFSELHEGMKKLTSDDDNGINFEEEEGDVRCYNHVRDRCPIRQRVRWIEQMVKHLINIVSFVEEDTSFDYLGCIRRKPIMSQKIGKWKCVSNIMVEMGYHVSPQQCEDKFSDLNKRYKKLNDVLGRVSLKVVENPELLDTMDLSDKEKKILSSKNLFYKEMCSYHNGNILQLPAYDTELQPSLQLAVKQEEQDAGFEDLINVMKDEIVDNPLNIESGKTSGAAKQDDQIDVNHVYPNTKQELGMALRSLRLKKLKLQLQVRKLEMNKQQFKWGRMNWYKNRDSDRRRLENERMKLENESLAFELEHKHSVIQDVVICNQKSYT